MSTITLGYTDSTALLDDPEALRGRAAEDGLLFFKGLLPRKEVLELRRQFLQILDKYGWLDRSHDLMEGVGNREEIGKIPKEELVFCGVGVPKAAYADVQRLELFHRLAHHPNLVGMYEKLFGKAVLPHPRNIARLMMPSANNAPTPPHQDFIHIQGTRNVWTCWFPVGDCPRELGNLSVIRGSHKDGLLAPKAAEGAGGLEVYLCKDTYEWIEDDFEAGDVLTFTSETVHKSLKPQLADRVRMSCDYRYQPADEDIEANSLRVHCDVTDWDDIYSGWERDDLKYYWKDRELLMSPWNEEIRWQKDKIC
jgi:hypothetical protein